MNLKKIGKSTVEVPVIGIGTNAVGGHNIYPNLDEEAGKELVRYGLSQGLTFLDTAFAYGGGRSEELIGEVIGEFPREEVIIATKASHDGLGGHRNDIPFIQQSIKDALKRLKTDYLDIFYLHYPDKGTPKKEIIHFLNEQKEAGLIRGIGVSNFSLEQLIEANAEGYVDVVQDEYNLLNRQHETGLMAYCLAENISFIPFVPLSSGLLTGKYETEVAFPDSDYRSKNPDFKGERFVKIQKQVSQLQPLAEKYQVEISHIVLQWYLIREDITALIPGAKTAAQVKDNYRAASFTLTAAEFTMIDELFPRED